MKWQRCNTIQSDWLPYQTEEKLKCITSFHIHTLFHIHSVFLRKVSIITSLTLLELSIEFIYGGMHLPQARRDAEIKIATHRILIESLHSDISIWQYLELTFSKNQTSKFILIEVLSTNTVFIKNVLTGREGVVYFLFRGAPDA